MGWVGFILRGALGATRLIAPANNHHTLLTHTLAATGVRNFLALTSRRIDAAPPDIYTHFCQSIDSRCYMISMCFCCCCFQKRRERGRISIKGVRLVEPAVLNNDGGDSSAPDVSSAETALPARRHNKSVAYDTNVFCFKFFD